MNRLEITDLHPRLFAVAIDMGVYTSVSAYKTYDAAVKQYHKVLEAHSKSKVRLLKGTVEWTDLDEL